MKLFGAKMGPTSAVHSTTKIMHPWLFELGDWSNVSANVTIYNLGRISIGSHSVISQDAYLCAGTHDYTDPTLPLERLPITVGHGVWIAAGAFIGPGVTVGDNSLVAARAVVVKDVPPEMIVGGNPARELKRRVMKESNV